MNEIIQKPIEERLIEASCIYWNIDRSYFTQKTQDPIVIYRKSLLYYLVKTHRPIMSFRGIGEMFGLPSHTSVYRLIENIRSTKDIYNQTNRDINQITFLADKLTAVIITRLETETH